MAWAFDGANSKLSAAITAVNSDWTFACWARPDYQNGVDASGEGSSGRMFSTEAGATLIQRLQIQAATLHIQALQHNGTTDGTALASTSLARTFPDWTFCVGRHTAATQVVDAYVGTLEQPPFEPVLTRVTGAGAQSTGGTTATIGNRNSQAATWNGYLEDVIFDTIPWPMEQIVAFWEGWRPGHNYTGLRWWLPLKEACNSATQAPVDVGAGLSWTSTSMGGGPQRPPVQMHSKFVSLYGDARNAAAAPSTSTTQFLQLLGAGT